MIWSSFSLKCAPSPHHLPTPPYRLPYPLALNVQGSKAFALTYNWYLCQCVLQNLDLCQPFCFGQEDRESFMHALQFAQYHEQEQIHTSCLTSSYFNYLGPNETNEEATYLKVMTAPLIGHTASKTSRCISPQLLLITTLSRLLPYSGLISRTISQGRTSYSMNIYILSTFISCTVKSTNITALAICTSYKSNKSWLGLLSELLRRV